MATPHLGQGASALMLEYLRTAGIEGDAMTLAYALMMSTAVPAEGSNGVTASPRKQGAGLVNLASAMATKAYLQVEGKERPKLELGDDPDKTVRLDDVPCGELRNRIRCSTPLPRPS